jgi:hypothetical protein
LAGIGNARILPDPLAMGNRHATGRKNLLQNFVAYATKFCNGGFVDKATFELQVVAFFT